MLFRQVLLVSRNKAALAAYNLGQLAESRIAYRLANQYSKQAAELQSDNPLYLNAVGMIAYTVGHYAKPEPKRSKSHTSIIRKIILYRTAGAGSPQAFFTIWC